MWCSLFESQHTCSSLPCPAVLLYSLSFLGLKWNVTSSWKSSLNHKLGKIFVLYRFLLHIFICNFSTIFTYTFFFMIIISLTRMRVETVQFCSLWISSAWTHNNCYWNSWVKKFVKPCIGDTAKLWKIKRFQMKKSN